MNTKGKRLVFALQLLAILLLGFTPQQHLYAQSLLIGISKTDITPTYPVRLTGYGNRTKVFDSVVQKIVGEGFTD